MRFLCGVTQVVKAERWVFKSGAGVHLSRQQLPLKLAWAISIHKSQVSRASVQGAGGPRLSSAELSCVESDSF